jgi:hypothetical protein
MVPGAVALSLACVALSLAAACTRATPPSNPAADSTHAAAADDTLPPNDSLAAGLPASGPADTASAHTVLPALPTAPLSALADSIAPYLVFFPAPQTWFLAAARGKHLLLDIGRVDADVKTKPARHAAYLEAVRKLSPVPAGARFRVRGSFGAEDLVVKSFDVWNGRIVARFDTAHAIDSLARATPIFVTAAQRVDTAAAPSPDSCQRGDVPPELRPRVLAIRDSLVFSLESLPPPPLPRLVQSEKPQWSTVVGCFGDARRIALAVDLRAGNNEWIRERVVLIDTLGAVSTVRVSDLRFKGHDLLGAFDADGDGVDDLVTRGFAEASGGMTILTLSDNKGHPRLQRLAGGFSWESR